MYSSLKNGSVPFINTIISSKMPKNTTGGSGHKSRANSEGNTAKKNRQLIENYIADITKDGKCEDVFVGKVTKKLGDGRMEVLYNRESVIAPIKGSLRGRGKSQAFIDVGTAILIAKTGLVGALSHEIIGVLNRAQVAQIAKIIELDPRISAALADEDGAGFAFDHEVDVDDI